MSLSDVLREHPHVCDSCVAASVGGIPLLIGLYRTLEILVDPYTDFARGATGIRALQSIDIAVRHAESFAAMRDAIA